MFAGVVDRWGRATIEEALIITTDATCVDPVAASLARIVRAGHPLPDARSVRAGEAALAVARRTRRDRLPLVVLVSGGASALMCAPIQGVTLRDKRAITKAMLLSGARVQQINVVRSHLSRVKGGGLAYAARQPLLTRIVSDVIGGGAGDVGSGPSIALATSARDARRLLHAWAPEYEHLPRRPRQRRTPPRGDVEIVASPIDLAEAVADELAARGISTRVLPPSQAPATELARGYGRAARRLLPRQAIVRAAEPSVTARGGLGGRSTHTAALVALELAGDRDVLFMAAATDGVDGSSGTAGAIVDGDTARTSRRRDRLARAIESCSTGPLLRALGVARPMGATGYNLVDLHVLVRPERG